MADTSPAANCMDKLKSYVKTPKGVILAAEIIRAHCLSVAPRCHHLGWEKDSRVVGGLTLVEPSLPSDQGPKIQPLFVSGGPRTSYRFTEALCASLLNTTILVSLIILICYAASAYGGYTAVAICTMIFAMIFFGIFMMEMDKQILVVNWLWSDLLRAGIGAATYIITSLIAVIGGSGDGARIAGGVFGLLAGILFAYDAYTIYLQVKSGSQHAAAGTDDTV
ncbi:unnamed protein product [Arctogadus glacialis]